LPVPEITFDGDGSLYLEWESSDKRLSIRLSGSLESSYIYLGEGGDYKAHKGVLCELTSVLVRLPFTILIGLNGSGTVCDIKTGQPKPSDHTQVMIYVWAVPRALPE